MRNRLAIIALVLIIIVAAVHIAGGAYVRGRIERAVAAQLPERLGPARSYTVEASGDMLDLIRGHLSALHIRGNGITLPSGVTVDDLNINARGITFDARHSVVVAVEKTEFTAHVTQARLNDYVAKNYPSMDRPQIELADGKLMMHAVPCMAGVMFPIDFEGIVRIDKDTRLLVDLKKFRAIGLKAPGIMRRTLERKLNPLLDTSTWPFRARLTSATIRTGAMTITGSVDLASR